MIQNLKKLSRQKLSGWLKFILIAVAFPLIAVGYSLNHVEKLQREVRLQHFQIESANCLDKIAQSTSPDEFICRSLNEIFESTRDVNLLKERVLGFSDSYDLDLQVLIWAKRGVVSWSNFDYQSFDVDWKKAFKALFSLSKVQVESLIESEDVNLRKIFGPHFFAKYHHHCYWDLKPRLIRGDSGEKRLPAWVRASRLRGVLVFVPTEKVAGDFVLRSETMEAKVPENCALVTYIDGKLITKSKLLSSFKPEVLKSLHESYDSFHHKLGFYIYKTFFRDKVSGFVFIPEKNLKCLHLSNFVKALLFAFISLLIAVLFISFRVIVLGYGLAINIRKQLLILFLLSNAFPLMIIGVLGYDYLLQYEGFLRVEAFAKGMTYLQNIDEMYVSEFSHQLREMDKAFKWLPEELKKGPPNLAMVEKFLARQSPKPFRLMLVGSHTAEVGSEIGILKNGQFVATINEDFAKYQSMRTLVDSLDKMGKYYLSRLNNEAISPKTMLRIELIAESLGQIKPIEMIQEFFAATGSFWQWGMGKQYYPAHIRVFSLSDSEKYDYVFLYLYKPHMLQRNYVDRVYEAVNRNDLGLKIVAVNETVNFSLPSEFLEQKELKDYASGLKNKSGAEVEFTEWKNESHMLMGLKCSFADRFRLIGLYPMKEISRKASDKYQLFMASGLLSLLISLSLGLIVSKSFLRPLAELQNGVLALKNRNFNFRLPDLGGDEFGRLAGIFNSTLVDLEELQVASLVQEKLLPDISQEYRAGCFHYSGLSVSFFRLGGDFIDNFSLDENRNVIVLGDVAGQGVGASLVMAFVKSCLLQLKNSSHEPDTVLRKINELICDTNTRKHRKFMTLQFLLLDGLTGDITVANAGHCFPIVISDGATRMVDLPSSPLGASRKDKIARAVVKLKTNESLVVYSGGMYRNPGLSLEKFSDSLLLNAEKDPKEFCQTVMDEVFSTVPKADCSDDLSLILVRKTVE